ncbi:hypothetical protein OIU77_014749 [Salix suchowensis]|uniref:Uncharacterized protein n=1 Tax=Salix suchowensis TaxID=1278906 RepID=A0ABQ8ZYV1_9ROSI|nr:hypothetical protein OIU77_014749 [Salix suchowensis]
MNFLLRPTTHQVIKEHVSAPVSAHESPAPAVTLEGLIAEDSFPQSEVRDMGIGGENGSDAATKTDSLLVLENHSDVSEEEGWIVIPFGELPDDWKNAPDIHSLRSLGRSFVFPGEQVHIMACLSAYKQDTEIITPFKVAAVMSKNGIGQSPEKQNGNLKDGGGSISAQGEVSSDSQAIGLSGNGASKQKTDPQRDISASKSLLRMEDYKRQTEMLLQRFKNSHFFVRIAESGEPLWSRKSALDQEHSEMDSQNKPQRTRKTADNTFSLSALIDRGKFDANVSGGAARNGVSCCSLSNGDIVVLLQVNVGVNFFRDPVIEILQFEKYQERNQFPDNQDNLNYSDYDPCGELLKWLLPVDNTLSSPARSLPPPQLGSNSGFGGASQKSSSSGSQLFSHFRSYSMSSLPQNSAPPSQPVKAQSSKPNFDLEDWDQYSSQKLWKSQKPADEELLSIRGVSLERERFSVRCGLEGIYIPGRKWSRKLEIIQPVEIHSFAADCNTDDLLCVQIKNVSPAITPDIVLEIITALPNLAIRRGEEHSFILKPASFVKDSKVHRERPSPSLSLHLVPNTVEGRSALKADQYAIIVSCRSNYTESRLFFKQPTSWRPRNSRDLLISVASEMSGQSSGPNERPSQLPVQVLALRASNLTSEDLTLTVLAPASFTSPPSVGSLSSSPTTPMSSFVGLPESIGIITGEKYGSAVQALTSVTTTSEIIEQSSPISDVISSTGLGCTHLWLQSRVPLGCVPAQSTATIKLELLPLTDGIISLDTLQIDVKEKGLTYIPEHSLKINATSSISTGII